jgi:hypothetical protein
MNFQERMAWAVEQNKQRQTTQRQTPLTARTTIKKTPTPDEYRTTTLQRVLTKMRINKEQA